MKNRRLTGAIKSLNWNWLLVAAASAFVVHGGHSVSAGKVVPEEQKSAQGGIT